MSNADIKQAIKNTGADDNPKFRIFSFLFVIFYSLFAIINLLIIFTPWLDRLIGFDDFISITAIIGFLLAVVLIIFAIIYLRSAKLKKEGAELTSSKGTKLDKITGWKAVSLFFGIAIIVALISILLPQ